VFQQIKVTGFFKYAQNINQFQVGLSYAFDTENSTFFSPEPFQINRTPGPHGFAANNNKASDPPDGLTPLYGPSHRGGRIDPVAYGRRGRIG
jgi:hypothetical protein